MTRIGRWVVAAGVLAAAAGCGVRPVPVSGVVTLDGKPLAGAVVTFLPADAESPIGASSAVTDEAGRYALRTLVQPTAGVGPGVHKVSISKVTKIANRSGPRLDKGDVAGVVEEGERELVPVRYNTNTDLNFDVPFAGTDHANFDLTGKK